MPGQTCQGKESEGSNQGQATSKYYCASGRVAGIGRCGAAGFLRGGLACPHASAEAPRLPGWRNQAAHGIHATRIGAGSLGD